MKKFKIVFAHPFQVELARKILGKSCVLRFPNTKSNFLSEIEDADVVLTLLSDRIDAKLLKKAKNVTLIGNYAVGVDNIDLQACKMRGIKVLNTPGVLTRATAELSVSLIFSAARRHIEGDDLCRKKQFNGWKPDLLLGVELLGKSAVIVGAGRIGNETGRILSAIGLKVSKINSKTSIREINSKLKMADVISIHLPGGSSTHHWLNKKRIALLKPTCIVVNTGRGTSIDEAALTDALSKKRIFAAGLDVYEFEPKIQKQLLKLRNVTLLPHLGSATIETRRKMAELLFTGVLGVLSGKGAANQVRIDS